MQHAELSKTEVPTSTGAPLIAVVITTYRAHRHLLCCIRSLIREPRGTSFEVVIYGDGGGLESEKALIEARMLCSEAGVPCHACYEPVNHGICVATNRACALASGQWLLLVNDDMVFPLEWQRSLLPHLKTRSVVSLGLIEPHVPGRTSASFIIRQTLAVEPDGFDFLELDLYQKNLSHGALLRPQKYLVPGINYPFCVERQLFFDVGGIDEGFSGPYHDPDLFLRLKLAGCSLVRFQGVVLYHFSGVSLRFLEGGPAASRKTKNWIKKEAQARVYFIKKWGAKPRTPFGSIPLTNALLPRKQQKKGIVDEILFVCLFLYEWMRAQIRIIVAHFRTS